LAESLGAGPGVAGAGFVAFSAAMLLGRLLGDGCVVRWGSVTTTRVGGLLAAGGCAAVVTTPWLPVVLIGFAAMGLGTCVVFPLVLSAAGETDGMHAGSAIAVVSLLGRFGFLIGPPLIGVVAEAVDLRFALGLVTLVAGTIAWGAPRVDPTAARGQTLQA
ncbi:MAG: MFS transporter, partial [Egibacteraceae bacterium]